MRKRQGKFQPDICPENVAAAAKVLEGYNYTGPVILACDDTKLLPSLQETANASGAWVIVGNVGEPLLVRNEDDLNNALKDDDIELASKVCLSLLRVINLLTACS